MIVAQIGARRHYAVPKGFEEAGALEKLITDACAELRPWQWMAALPQACLPGGARSIMGRHTTPIPARKLRGLPRFAAAGALWDRQSGDETRTDFWVRRNADFGRRVARLDWGAADTAYAYNGAALEIFKEARRRGLRCVLDQTAAPWRYNTRLLQEERERWPGWESQPADLDETGRMIEREEAEWELADRIICGSDFVVEAMRQVGGPWEKCRTVGYPTPKVPEELATEQGGHQTGKTRVLFVGTLQLRKGIQYLYEAAGMLDSSRFKIRAVGPSALDPGAVGCLAKRMEVTGAVPRTEIWEHYRWADVFVLPTLSEGSANVCHEAAAIGLPVITTQAAGCGLSTLPGGSSVVSSRDPELLVKELRQINPAVKGPSPGGAISESYGECLLATVGPNPSYHA